jgi:lipopolysaccharide/colanic/teichoic acid biosynthesis glycosyltransferase
MLMSRYWCYRCVAFFILLLLLPVFVVTSVLILLFMGRPIFFKQPRVGRYQVLFVIYKFRSMEHGRVNFLGGVLRATGIDELPQLWNIVRGEMSFVGPRPLMTDDIARLGWHHHYYHSRWLVLPGLTGLAQLSRRCHKKISWFYDMKYVRDHSWRLDAYIMLKSLCIPLLGKSLGKKLFNGKC